MRLFVKLWTHKYQLNAKTPLNARSTQVRHGALLKIAFEEGIVGYSDLFPWEELGDQPLTEQLKHQNSPQFLRSVQLAKEDALSRNRGESLFKGLTIPKSHNYLKGIVKKKMGFNLKEEIAFIKTHPESTWRLDFNETLTELEFREILPEFKGVKVDFYEDPFPFEESSWRSLTLTGVPLAVDRGALKALDAPDSVSVFVVKPALYSSQPFLNSGKRVVITSYMDHPIGQLFAAYEAAKYQKKGEMAGLLSHTLYEETFFSKELKVVDDVLIPPQGLGIGFDYLLEKLSWEAL